MSLRSESLKAYRQLYRAASIVAVQCPLYNQEGLQRYVSHRVQQEAEQNRRQVSLSLQELEDRAKRAAGATANTRETRKLKRDLANRQKKLLRQYEKHVSQQIDRTHTLAAMLPNAVGDEALTSLLQVLAAGVGNTSYQRTMESNFANFFTFAEKRAARDEATEEATSERQNRIMQQAILPYGERLLLVHRTAIGSESSGRGGSLSYLTPWQVTEAIVGTRSGVTAHHVRLGRDHVVVEIDETFNKQVIYLACTRAEGDGTSASAEEAQADSGSYNWYQEIERVDVSESEEIRQTLFHSEFLVMATRLCDALLNETPLHPTRKTVLVGHAVGGAVSLITALLLVQRAFEVTNVITFGAPKSMQGTLDRYVAAVNPVRVVLAGDPLVELPVSGTEGEPFRHVGEILVLSPHGESDGKGERETAHADAVSPGRPARSEHREGTKKDVAQASSEGVMSAEDLAAAMNMDDDSGDSDARATEEPPRASCAEGAEGEEGGAAVGHDDAELAEEGAESDGDDNDDFDLGELCRIAEARYRQHFLVEDYIRHLADPSVELIYAEGDEVWDEGAYQTDMRDSASEPLVSPDERRQRDLRGPL